MPAFPEGLGIILVDHGSRRDEANALLDQVVPLVRESTGVRIVEAAHMELASPTISDAFAACVEQGATQVAIHPYFLAPGRHSTEDIPAMAAEAAAAWPDVPYTVSKPLGLDARLGEVIADRIREAL